MKAVAPETPTDSSPPQMNAPSRRPQMNELTPGAIEGGRRWGMGRTLTPGEGRKGYPQAARLAVEMWIIEFPQIADLAFLDLLHRPRRGPRFPLAPSTEPE